MSVKIREDGHGYPKVAIVPYRYLRELERDTEDYRRLLAQLDMVLDGEVARPRRRERGRNGAWATLWKHLRGHRPAVVGAAPGRDGEAEPELPAGNVHRFPLSRRRREGSG